MFRVILWPLGVARRRPVASFGVVVLVTAVAAAAGAHCLALYQFREAGRALDDDLLSDAHDRVSFCLAVWPWSAPTHVLAARVARLSGAYAEADTQLGECRRLQKGPTEETQLETLLLRTQQGDVDELAGGLLYAADHDKGRERDILEALARGDIKLMRFVPALAVLNRCLKGNPDDVRALNWRGWLLDRMDRHEAAVADYERALELCPAHADARLRLASSYLDHNDPAAAEPHLRVLARALPERTEVRVELARCRFLLGEESELRALLDEVLAAHPDEPTALLYHGKLDVQEGRPEEAEGSFRRVLEQDPNSAEALNGLYDSLRGRPGREAEAGDAQKKYNRMVACGDRMRQLAGEVERDLGNPAPACELGKVNLELGREDVGVYWLNVALDRDPNHGPTHAVLADFFDKKGDKARAIQERRLARENGAAATP